MPTEILKVLDEEGNYEVVPPPKRGPVCIDSSESESFSTSSKRKISTAAKSFREEILLRAGGAGAGAGAGATGDEAGTVISVLPQREGLYSGSRERLENFRRRYKKTNEAPPNPEATIVYVVLAAGKAEGLLAFVYEELLRTTQTGLVLITENFIEPKTFPLLARTVVDPRHVQPTCWASLEIVDNTVLGMQEALERYPKCEFIHTMSGDSVPVKSGENAYRGLTTAAEKADVKNTFSALKTLWDGTSPLLPFLDSLGFEDFYGMNVEAIQWFSVQREIAAWIGERYERYRPFFKKLYEGSFKLKGHPCIIHPGRGVCPDQQVLATLIHLFFPLEKHPEWIKLTATQFEKSFRETYGPYYEEYNALENGDFATGKNCMDKAGKALPNSKCNLLHSNLLVWDEAGKEEMKKYLATNDVLSETTTSFRKVKIDHRLNPAVVLTALRDLWSAPGPKRSQRGKVVMSDNLYETGLQYKKKKH